MKKILYVLVGLIAIYLILCIIGPSSSKVERSIDIAAPGDVIKSNIIDLKFFHDTWSPWTEKDPNMQVTYTGYLGQKGYSMAWESTVKEVGKGSMTYQYTHGDTIMELLHFDDYGDSQVYHVVTPNSKGAKVTWTMENKIPFPFRAMMLFMDPDKMVGPDFEKGLAKLKVAMEDLIIQSNNASIY